MNIDSLYPIFQDKWGDKNTIWVYSDPHFSDTDMVRYFNRPSDDFLLKKINEKVGKNDVFICLGDVGNVEYVRRIRGYKTLICGNHDAGAANYQREKKVMIFNKSSYSLNEAISIVKKAYPNQRISWEEQEQFWAVFFDNMLFDEVYTGPLMIGEKLILSHEPVNVDWAFNIHGHDHSDKEPNAHGRLNVCAEHINYYPLNLNKFLKSGRLKEVESLHRQTINEASKKYQ